ncbi:hypothetical protein Holit_02124 [Hollandina sp. SP2]
MRLYSPLPQDVVYPAFTYANPFGKASHAPMGIVLRFLLAGHGAYLMLRFHADRRFPGFAGFISSPSELNRVTYRITDERLTSRNSDMLYRRPGLVSPAIV